ncbi:MAG: hypothetical protein GF333_07980 [Candidatus Omnitrophica bacterium]|nr:hypothetical protein [Candidatus Omnitrophota bacterium]
MKRRNAQSVLEYVIVLSAIIAAVILGARRYITPAIDQMYSDSAGVVQSQSTLFLDEAAGGGNVPHAGEEVD